MNLCGNKKGEKMRTKREKKKKVEIFLIFFKISVSFLCIEFSIRLDSCAY